MAKTFEIHYAEYRDLWVSLDPKFQFQASHPNDGTPREVMRQRLFDAIDAIEPGLYRFEYDIEEVRGEVLARIDRRSDTFLESFEFEGIVFSLSEKAQIRYEYMDRTRETGKYPLPINSRDDRTMLVLRDAEHLHAFCQASADHVFDVVVSGTIEKNIIRAATTVEELQAYVDPR